MTKQHIEGADLAADFAPQGYERKFIIYYHYVARVYKKEREYMVRVVKLNTGEIVGEELYDERGMPFTLTTAEKRCADLESNPWEHMDISVKFKEDILREQEEREKFKEKKEILEYEKRHMEELIEKEAKRMFAEMKQADKNRSR